MLIPDLVKTSTSETAPWVAESVDFLMVCPTKLAGFPEILSATSNSLLKNSAEEGLGRYCSKSTTLGSTPYRALNRILNDSSVPFDSYKLLASLIKLLTSRFDWKSTSSSPGVRVTFNFL